MTFSQGQLFIAEADLEQHIIDFWQNWRREDIKRQQAEYGQIYPPELPPKEIAPRKAVREIAAQHGLLVEQLQGIYSFSHLALQEYFTALYITENENRGSVEWLMSFVDNDLWQEIFIMTAGMLKDATEFCQLLLQAVNHIVADDSEVIVCLKWVEAEVDRLELPYKLAFARAIMFYFALKLVGSIAIDHDNKYDYIIKSINYFDFTRASDLDPEFIRIRDIDPRYKRGQHYSLISSRASNSSLDLARAGDLVLNNAFYYYFGESRSDISFFDRKWDYKIRLARIFNPANVYDLERAQSLDRVNQEYDLVRARAKDLDAALQIAEQLGLKKMQETLQTLIIPEQTASLEIWQAFADKLIEILGKYGEDWDPHHLVELDVWDIVPFTKLSIAQLKKLQQYFNANLLLVRCLEVAYVPDNQAIEDRILLPPPS